MSSNMILSSYLLHSYLMQVFGQKWTEGTWTNTQLDPKTVTYGRAVMYLTLYFGYIMAVSTFVACVYTAQI